MRHDLAIKEMLVHAKITSSGPIPFTNDCIEHDFHTMINARTPRRIQRNGSQAHKEPQTSNSRRTKLSGYCSLGRNRNRDESAKD